MTTSNLSQALTEASLLEQRAMAADRACRVSDAIDLYAQSIEKLHMGLSVCPFNHPDAYPIQKHIGEIQNRISYLSSLSVTAKPLIPLESHIYPVELSVTSSQTSSAASSGSTMGTAAVLGGVGGLLLLGPVGLVAGAAGAAYASTRSDQIGSTTRGVARTSVAVVDKVIDVNREHGIGSRAMELGSAAISKASEINEKYEVTNRVKAAGTEAYRRLSTFDQEYKVTEGLGMAISAGWSTISGFLQPSSGPPQ
jgi:hypothetical protein